MIAYLLLLNFIDEIFATKITEFYTFYQQLITYSSLDSLRIIFSS